MNKYLMAAFAVALLFVGAGAAVTATEAQAVPSEPVITVERTACDELTLTVTTTISHPEEETGHYTLEVGWLNDGLPQVEYVIASGVAVHVYTEKIDLPNESATFRAELEIEGYSPDPFDERVIGTRANLCPTATPTNTPVPPTATPTPAPTQTPVIIVQSSSIVTACEGTTMVTRTNGVVTGSVGGDPRCAPVIVRSVITPPRTGDGGLVN